MVEPIKSLMISSDLKVDEHLPRNFSAKIQEGRLSTGQKVSVVGWALLGSILPVIGTLFAIFFSLHHYRIENKRKLEDKRISQYSENDSTIKKANFTGTESLVPKTKDQNCKITQLTQKNPKSEPKNQESNNQISGQNNQVLAKDDSISEKNTQSNQNNKAIASLASNKQTLLDELQQALSRTPIFEKVPKITHSDVKNSTPPTKIGLPNSGNVCWMNSVLKILAATSEFDYLWNAPLSEISAVCNLQRALVKIINELRDVKKSGTSITKEDLDNLITALKCFDQEKKCKIFTDEEAIIGKDQKDAVEFVEGLCVKLTELLNLQNKCQKAQIVYEYRPQSDFEAIKYAKIENRTSILRIQADEVQESNINLENHLFLEEKLDASLEFDAFSNGSVNNGEKTKFVLTLGLLNAPNNLAICIGRDAYNRETFEKINKKITIPLDGKIRLWENTPIDEKERIIVNANNKTETVKIFHQTKRTKQHTYQLESALVHQGNADAGHWVSFTRLENGKFLYHSDTYVEEQTPKKAMEAIAEASLLRFKKVNDDANLSDDDSFMDSTSANSSDSDDDSISNSSDDDTSSLPSEFDDDDVLSPVLVSSSPNIGKNRRNSI